VFLDYSVYPDLEQLPDTLDSPEQKADYLARVCGAWDFGIVPTAETFALFQDWETIFEQFPRLSSPAYAAFRASFGWSCRPSEPILQANYERLDNRGISPDCWIAQEWRALLDPNAMNTPHIPPTLDPIAVELLTKLRAYAECAAIVLGGHFALKHYVDYRSTHNIYAWCGNKKTIWSCALPKQKSSGTFNRLSYVVQLHHFLRSSKFLFNRADSGFARSF
jgi:hypothetical protein